MCVAIPLKLIKKKGMSGVVDLDGVEKEVSLQLVKKAKVGDYLIVHAGFAIQILDEEEAKKTLEIIEELYI